MKITTKFLVLMISLSIVSGIGAGVGSSTLDTDYRPGTQPKEYPIDGQIMLSVQFFCNRCTGNAKVMVTDGKSDFSLVQLIPEQESKLLSKINELQLKHVGFSCRVDYRKAFRQRVDECAGKFAHLYK